MALDRDDVISVLNDLIETCEDGVNGFRTAADSVKSTEAKAVFTNRIKLIERSAAELQAEVRRLGGDPERRGSVAGSLHRGWINLKSAVTGKDDDAIINECVRGEETAVKSYEDALEKDLPADVRAIVEHQYRGTLQNLDKVRVLKGEPGMGTSATRPRSADREAPPPV
jgi:uncharacterized protein (TIGR02284 family)